MHHLVHIGKAHADPVVRARQAAVGLGKRLEDVLDLAGGDADAGIPDSQVDSSGRRTHLGGDADLA